MKEAIKAKLGKIRSNLILRLLKNTEKALNLKAGEEVLIKIKSNGLSITPV